MDLKPYFSVDHSQLTDDEKEEICQLLIGEDELNHLSDPNDLTNALSLFQVSLRHKVSQVVSLGLELDEYASKQGELEAHYNQEIDYLRGQLSKRSYDTNQNGSASEDDFKQLLHTSELNAQKLLAELETQEQEHLSNKLEMEKMESQIAALENDRLQLKRELLALREEIQDQQRDFEPLPQESKKSNQQLLEALRQKNKQLSLLLNDVEVSEKENISLREKLTNIKVELAEATNNIIRTTGEIVTLQVTKEEQSERVRFLEQMCEALRHQVEDLVNEKQKRDAEFDEFEQNFDARIRELKDIVGNKDKELIFLKEQLAHHNLKGQNVLQTCESDQLTLLSQALEKRECQIDELKTQLSQATKDLDETTSLLENMQQATEMSNSKQGLPDVNISLKQLATAEKRVKSLEAKLKDAEIDAEGKSEEITKMIIQLRSYELGEFGLNEALAQVKELLQQRSVRDKHIEQLVETANVLKNTCDSLQEDNSLLREKLNIPTEEHLKTSASSLKIKEENVVMIQQQQIDRLEEDLISAKVDRRNLSQQVVSLTKHIQELEAQTLSQKGSGSKLLNRSQADARAASRKIRSLQHELHQLNIERQSLIEENESLRQGLHDILDSVHLQDGESSVHVESKVLEHLLHALDSRHISGWYHPAMRIQAKANAVEGNNEALREQLRSLREEHASIHSELQKARIRITELEGSKKEMLTVPSESPQSTKMPQAILDAPISFDLSSELNADSLSIISKLNNHLLLTVHEHGMEKDQVLETYTFQSEIQRQLDDLVAQLEKVVEQQTLEREKWQTEKIEFEERINGIQIDLAASEARGAQLLDMWNTFSATDDVNKENIIQDVLSIASLVAEKEKFERIASAALSEASLAKREHKLIKHEWNSSKSWIMRQFGELLQFKRTALICMSHLESKLLKSVDLESWNAANRQSDEITAKYNELLRNHEIAKSKADQEIRTLSLELQHEKALKVDLVRKVEEGNRKIYASKYSCGSSEKDLTFLLAKTEAEVLRERQQVLHSEKMLEISKGEVEQVSKRCRDLEKEVLALLQANQELKLMNSSSDTLLDPSKIQQEDRKNLESQLAHAQAEVLELQTSKRHLKELADISEAQVLMLDQLLERSELQLESARQTVYKMQSNSDKGSEIARLSGELCAVQLNELAAKNQISSLENQLSKAFVLGEKHMKEINKLEEALNVLKEKHLDQQRKMHQEIVNLRRQSGNVLPLAFFHLLATAHMQCSAECRDLWHNLQAAEDELASYLSRKEEAQTSCEQTLELQRALKAEHSDLQCQNLIESWSAKVTELKLKELKSSRERAALEASLKQSQDRLLQQDSLMFALEKQLLLLGEIGAQSFVGLVQRDTKQADKEMLRPVETPIKITLASDENQFESKCISSFCSYEMKDNSQVRNAESEISNTLAADQLVFRENKIRELSEKLTKNESDLESYKKICGELRQSLEEKELKHSADVPLDSPIIKTVPAAKVEHDRIALQATVDSLKNIIVQKEESIGRYQKLLRDVREEDARIITTLQEHLLAQQSNLSAQEQANVRLKISMHNLSLETSYESNVKAALDVQLTRSNELEDEVALLTSKISKLSSEMEALMQESTYWKEVAQEHLSTIEELKQQILESKAIDQEKKKPSFDLQCHKVQGLSNLKTNGYVITGKKEAPKLNTTKGGLSRSTASQIQTLSTEVSDLQNKICKMEEQERLHTAEIRRLRDQIPIYSRRLQQSHSGSLMPEREAELLKKIHHLEQELALVKQEHENAIIQRSQQENKKIESVQNVARWDERKKHQMFIERLKRSLQEQTSETTLLHEKVDRMHSTIHRLEREKIALENQIRNLHHLEQEKTLLEERLKADEGHSTSHFMLNKLQEDRDRLFTEVNILRAKLKVIDQGNIECVSDTIEKERATLLKTNLGLECENLELKLELEKMRSEAPCLQHKVAHLERMLLDSRKQLAQKSSSESSKLEQDNVTLQKIIQHMKEQLEASHSRIRTLESSQDVGKVLALQSELHSKSMLLCKVKTLLERAALKERQLTEQVQALAASISRK